MMTLFFSILIHPLFLAMVCFSFFMQSSCNHNNSGKNLADVQNEPKANSDKSIINPPQNLVINSNDQYLVYYDSLNEAKIETVVKADFKLIILAQNSLDKDITRRKDQIKRLKNGGQTQVLVYLTIGEDDRCQDIHDEEKKLECGKNSPATDKRGPVYWKNGEKVYEDKGYPSYLVDGMGEWNEKEGKKYFFDGKPDYNGVFGGFYVDAGNPDWQEITKKRAEKLLSAGFDGLFLDTLDTADTDYWYPETQSGMLALIKSLKDFEITKEPVKHPIIVANRGLFFFKPAKCEICENISGMMFVNYFTSEIYEDKRGDYSDDYKSGTNQKILANILKKQEQFKNIKVIVLDYVYSNQTNPKCKDLLDKTLKAYVKDKLQTPFYISSGLENLPETTPEGKLDYTKKWCK